MADVLAAAGPLPEGLLFEAPHVRVSAPPPQPRWLLQGGLGAHAAVAAALGLPAPAALRAHARDGLAMLWLGPDETLLVDAPQADVAAALADVPHALVDVSDRDGALDVEGADAETLLACAILLDLHETAFPVSACARTLVGKAPALLWRRGPHAFRLLVPRSFAPYARDLLREGLHGLGD